MEALAFLFVVSIFIWLLQPEVKPRPKKPGDKIEEGLKAVAQIMGPEWKSDGGNGGGKDKGSNNFGRDSIVVALLFGLMMAFVLQ